LSELSLTEKLKLIPKDKYKKIKGRNNINIIIIGFNEVGKSSLCIRLVENNLKISIYPQYVMKNLVK
jgi:GTPase SAR1 family protein